MVQLFQRVVVLRPVEEVVHGLAQRVHLVGLVLPLDRVRLELRDLQPRRQPEQQADVRRQAHLRSRGAIQQVRSELKTKLAWQHRSTYADVRKR